MAKRKEQQGLAPICEECGGRTTYYTTSPKTDDRPPLIVYKCDHCGTVTTVTEPKESKE